MKIKQIINKIVNYAEDTMFPHYVCPFCGVETPDGVICKDCEELKIQPKFCPKCGEHISDSSVVCIECKELERMFDQNFSCFNYQGNVATAIQKLKFNGAKYLAKDFAKILETKFKDLNISIGIVTFVPSTSVSKKKRGYNQAEEIAKEFSVLTGIPCLEILSKTKETAHQTELSKKQRLKNLIGSFVCIDKWQVIGKNILVIDDVFTTGSTMSACAKALKKARANKVYGLTVAKTAIKN